MKKSQSSNPLSSLSTMLSSAISTLSVLADTHCFETVDSFWKLQASRTRRHVTPMTALTCGTCQTYLWQREIKCVGSPKQITLLHGRNTHVHTHTLYFALRSTRANFSKGSRGAMKSCMNLHLQMPYVQVDSILLPTA